MFYLLLTIILNIFSTPSRVKVSGTLLEKKEKIEISLEESLKRKSGSWEKEIKKQIAKMKYSIALWNLSGNTLTLKLIPKKVIRNVFIRGNWPLFETDIMRRIILRAGTTLPPAGKIRQDLFNSQVQRIEDYLYREGYFDSKIKIILKGNNKTNHVDLLIELKKGSSYKLGKITFKGNKHVKSSVLEKFFRHKVLFYEKPFYKQQFRKDMKKLIQYYRKLGYYAVSARNNFNKLYSLDRKNRKVNITVFITERRKVEIKFEGLVKAGRNELLKQLTFIDSGTYDDQEIIRSAKSIRHHYQTKGFFNATIFPESHLTGDSYLNIIFHIQVGKEHRVGKIIFRGNKKFSSSELKSEIATKVFPKKLALFGMGSGGYITPKQLKQDEERIKKLYEEAGIKNSVVKATVIYPKAGKYISGYSSINAAVPTKGGRTYITVIYTIKEGIKVVFNEISFKGIKKSYLNKFQQLCGIKKGDPFSAKKISKAVKKITRYVANLGYPYHKITTEISKDSNNNGINVLFKITFNKRVRLGPVFLRGNFKTKHSVIWREIIFRQGEIFNLSKIEKAARNLRSLGVFRSVRISFIGLKEQQEVVPVVVSIIERYDDYGELEVGAGFSTDNLYFASLSFNNKNLFGYAKSLQMKGEAGSEILSGTVTYQDSRFLGSKLLFQILGYGRSEKTVRLGDIITYGSSVTLKKRWSQKFQWFIRYEIRHVSYKENLYRVSSGMGEDSKVNFATTTASFGPAFVWDKRDNPLIPTKGYRLSSSVRIASRYLGGDDDFIHLNLAGQFFIKLPFGLTIAQGIRYDHGIPLFDTHILPKVERFFAGGDTTVRGYEEDRLFTQIVKTPMLSSSGLTYFVISPVGGNIRFVSNSELQFPIWKKSPLLGMPIKGAFFFDAGYIINSYSGFDSTLFHMGYGSAIRLVTPVGVISFEYAFPLNKVWGTDLTGRFHFNFGFIF